MRKYRFVSLGIRFCLILIVLANESNAGNVIILIGDGMGPEQIKAANYYQYGTPDGSVFESAPCTSTMTTHSADNAITDSAASGTAMSTGRKVNNNVVAQEIPGSGQDLKTIVEHFKEDGRNTGIVTTAYLTHATPASFAGHAATRSTTDTIAVSYLNGSRPNLMFGGGGQGLSRSNLETAGYLVAETKTDMWDLDNQSTHVAAILGNDLMPYEYDGYGTLPHLSDMTSKTLQFLSKDPKGFFLMIEGALIDLACHYNDIDRLIPEVVEFENTVRIVLDWLVQHPDTLVVATADHETGGLQVVASNGLGNVPAVTWSSNWHTARRVDVFAWGKNAQHVVNVDDNTHIHDLLMLELTQPVEYNSVNINTWNGLK